MSGDDATGARAAGARGGTSRAAEVTVVLPEHLRNLAGVQGAVLLRVEGTVTLARVLDELERRHPVLRGTIREHATLRRRPYVRYFAAGADLSHSATDAALPRAVARGEEPLVVVGAMAGG